MWMEVQVYLLHQNYPGTPEETDVNLHGTACSSLNLNLVYGNVSSFSLPQLILYRESFSGIAWIEAEYMYRCSYVSVVSRWEETHPLSLNRTEIYRQTWATNVIKTCPIVSEFDLSSFLCAECFPPLLLFSRWKISEIFGVEPSPLSCETRLRRAQNSNESERLRKVP